MHILKNSYSIAGFTFVLALLLSLFTTDALALEPADKWEGPIDYAATGGSFLEDTCYAGPTGCILGQFDNQGDMVTATSSAGMYGIPEGVNVVKAYLIWMGSVDAENGNPDMQLTLLPPSGKEYEVTALAEDMTESIKDDFDADDLPATYYYYTNRVDVTKLLQDHNSVNNMPLNGSYTVKNFTGYADEPYLKRQVALGGWSLFLVYSKSGSQSKRIYYYNYFDQIRDQVLELEPTGFVAPENAIAKFTMFVGEGDPGIEGSGTGVHDESIFFNNIQLVDNCNTANNPFNGTVNTNLDQAEGDCREQVYSIDLDTFFVSEYLTAGDTGANIELSLGQDLVIPNYFVLSISSKRSDFDIPNKPEKSASVSTGGFLAPEEVFTYYIYVQNNGENVATDVKVRDQLPSELVYIENSTYVIEPNGDRRKIDDIEGGFAPSTNSIAIASSLPPGEAHRRVVEIGVRLKSESDGIVKGNIINNTAEIISGRGDIFFTNGGSPVTHTVRLEAYEGTMQFAMGKKHSESRFVAPGETGVVLAQINLSSENGDVALSNMIFTPADQTNGEVVDSATLYWDLNSNGKVDLTDRQLGETSNWSVGGLVFSDFSVLGSVKENQQQNLLLTGDISQSAMAGDSSQLELLSDNVSVRGFVRGLPFKTAMLYLPDSSTVLSAEPGLENPSDGYLTPGAESNVLQFKLRSYASAVNIQAMTFQLEGTIYDATELESLELFRDSNQDGIFGATDVTLATTPITTDDQLVVFSTLNESLPANSEMHYALKAKFSVDAGENKNFRISLNAVDAGGQSALGTPVMGGLLTISSDLVACDSDQDCILSLDDSWYCDQLLSVCKQGDVADGDMEQSDGDIDGDMDTEIDEESASGGCQNTKAPSALILLIALCYLAVRSGMWQNASGTSD